MHLIIYGRVQGVLYRYSACQEATALGIAGFIRNCTDGTVEVYVEGEESDLLKMASWCRQGSPGARVESVKTNWQQVTGRYKHFVVK